jgi:uncharacterized membrane protein
MTMLIAAAAVFLAIHLLISGTRVRDTITGTIGEGPYMGLFSLASIGVIVWMAIAYNAAQASGDDRILWVAGIGLHHMALPIILLAFIIGVPGLLTPNPTSVRQEGAAAKAETVRGVLRITRHPFLWGVAIWSAFHLAVNGDEASVIFFGTFLVLSVLGTFSIDTKRKRKLGDAWTGFAAKTSNIPFVASLTGRTTFKPLEYFDWRFFAAVLLYCVVLLFHSKLFGVSPFPNGLRIL